MIYLIIWLMFGFAAAFVAPSDDSAESGCWFMLGVLFGPLALIGAFIMAVSKRAEKRQKEMDTQEQGKAPKRDNKTVDGIVVEENDKGLLTTCEACDNEISIKAEACPICGHPND